MRSQNNEEEIILQYVERHEICRTFLEIGAYDPIVLSNTIALVELGWSGVYVEPAPENAARFLKKYRGNSKIQLVNAAIGLTSELVTFYDSGGDALSTLSSEHVTKWEQGAGVQFTPYLTKSITIPELLGAVGKKFGFINLDVESLNLQLFRQLPIKELIDNGLRLICVEHDGFYDEIRNTSIGFGFRELAFNGENLIFGL